eukprot:6534167-Pyramimonas_sp.AAC.1
MTISFESTSFALKFQFLTVEKCVPAGVEVRPINKQFSAYLEFMCHTCNQSKYLPGRAPWQGRKHTLSHNISAWDGEVAARIDPENIAYRRHRCDTTVLPVSLRCTVRHGNCIVSEFYLSGKLQTTSFKFNPSRIWDFELI